MKLLVYSVVCGLLLAACSPSNPPMALPLESAAEQTETLPPDELFATGVAAFSSATPPITAVTISTSATTEPLPSTKTATPEPTHIVGPPRCLDSIVQRPLNEPPEQRPGGERYTLSSEEFDEYLALMGIESVCIPEQFEAPFLNVDWNGFEETGTAIGRMTSIGFDGVYPGWYGWGFNYIVYSTYDFEVGSEYNVWASEEDRDRVRDQSKPNLIKVGGVDGFTRLHEGLHYGAVPIYKVHIFPFESHYMAFVADVGHYDFDEFDEVMGQMESGSHPDLLHNHVRLMDYLVSTLQFKDGFSQ